MTSIFPTTNNASSSSRQAPKKRPASSIRTTTTLARSAHNLARAKIASSSSSPAAIEYMYYLTAEYVTTRGGLKLYIPSSTNNSRYPLFHATKKGLPIKLPLGSHFSDNVKPGFEKLATAIQFILSGCLAREILSTTQKFSSSRSSLVELQVN